ncbi:hypothetical protein BDW59DRAFT_161801 [Aspergillus cavernicola]|uniref:protein-ribulosamine 3-kinase n=1 Tax=Aspergillus cavernicola TaxID=176166 RepID=A0ABR4IC57_9EURO
MDHHSPSACKGPRRYRNTILPQNFVHTIMKGEFHTRSIKQPPISSPKPHSWGRYHHAEIYFYLSEFVDMNSSHPSMPDPDDLALQLAHLHNHNSSPTGMFGFHTPTCSGSIPFSHPWTPSWTTVFTNLLSTALTLDTEANGPWTDLSILSHQDLAHALPRLIGILETSGRSLKPSLIHSDL